MAVIVIVGKASVVPKEAEVAIVLFGFVDYGLGVGKCFFVGEVHIVWFAECTIHNG